MIPGLPHAAAHLLRRRHGRRLEKRQRRHDRCAVASVQPDGGQAGPRRGEPGDLPGRRCRCAKSCTCVYHRRGAAAAGDIFEGRRRFALGGDRENRRSESRSETKDIKIYRLKPNSKDREIIAANYDLIRKQQQKDIMLQPYDIVEVDKARKA